jgi:hypothetical protein
MAPSPVTISGYALKEVMETLEQRMMGKEYDYVCLMVAEVVCSNHARRLSAHLVSMLSQRYLTRNLGVLDTVLQRLETIDRRKYNGNERAVRAAAVEAALILAREPPSEISFQKYIDAHDGKLASTGHPGPPANSLNLAPPSSPHVQSSIVLLYGAMATLFESPSGSFNAVATALHASMAMDANYKDVIETLWEMVGVFLKTEVLPRSTQPESVWRYFDCCRRMYWIGMTKLKRKERLNLLWACVYMACKGKQVVGESKDAIVPLPYYDIDALYRQVECDGVEDFSENQDIEQIEEHTEPITKTIATKATKSPTSRGAQKNALSTDEAERVEFLKYYTESSYKESPRHAPTIDVMKVVNVRGKMSTNATVVVLDKHH